MTTSNQLPLTVNQAVEAKIQAWLKKEQPGWLGVLQQRQTEQAPVNQKTPDVAQGAPQKDVYNTMFWDVAH